MTDVIHEAWKTKIDCFRTFLPLWEMLQVELSQSASLHSEYSTSIIDSIEHPLRSSIHANKDFIDIQRVNYIST